MVKPIHFQAYSLKQQLIMQMFLNITLIYMQSYYMYFIDLVSLEQYKIPTTFCAKYSFVKKKAGVACICMASFLFNTTGPG